MIDPATSWFEMSELPLNSVTHMRKGEEMTNVITDKTSAQMLRLFNKQWLSHYPRSTHAVFDNGSEFKMDFTALCKSHGLEPRPTSVKNPQANATLERVHGTLGNMLRTSGIDMSDTVTAEDVDNFITDAAWAIRSSHHTALSSSPGAAIFG